jgi:hypothetical protein
MQDLLSGPWLAAAVFLLAAVVLVVAAESGGDIRALISALSEQRARSHDPTPANFMRRAKDES